MQQLQQTAGSASRPGVPAASKVAVTGAGRSEAFQVDITKPVIALSSRVATATDRTALTVKVSEASVSKFMHATSSVPTGVLPAFPNTWQALQVRQLISYAYVCTAVVILPAC